MKILLLGEYSGLYSNLRDGLRRIGHDAVLAASGDAWKKMASDIPFNGNVPFVVNKAITNIKPFFLLNHLSGYDVVQIINPLILYRKFGINSALISWVLNHNDKAFLSAAGDDAFYVEAVESGRFRYSPLPDYINRDLAGRAFPHSEPATVKWTRYLASKVSGIIPIAYEYAEAYRGHENRRSAIPMPINVDKIKYTENSVKGKVVIYHGVTRPGFKGSHYIQKAFETLRRKYPNDVELVFAEKLPYADYLTVIKRANVIVDQTSSYSCGMNALLSMAMGKVVLSGNEPEASSEFRQEPSPAINILPDSLDIQEKIEIILSNKTAISDIGARSRHFIERYHDYTDVAEKYVKTWKA